MRELELDPLRKVVNHYETIESQECRMGDQRSLDALEKKRQSKGPNMDGSVSENSDDSSDSETLHINALECAKTAIEYEDEIDSGINMNPTNIPFMERTPMPGRKISQSKHAHTEQAQHPVRLTKAIIACKRSTEEDGRIGDGMNSPKRDLSSILSGRVQSLHSEQKKIYDSVLFDLDQGEKTKRVVEIGAVRKSYLTDTISLLLVVRGRREAQTRREYAIRRRHSALVKTTFTSVADASISGLTCIRRLKCKERIS